MRTPFDFDSMQPDAATTDEESALPQIQEPIHQRAQLNRIRAEDLGQKGIPSSRNAQGNALVRRN